MSKKESPVTRLLKGLSQLDYSKFIQDVFDKGKGLSSLIDIRVDDRTEPDKAIFLDPAQLNIGRVHPPEFNITNKFYWCPECFHMIDVMAEPISLKSIAERQYNIVDKVSEAGRNDQLSGAKKIRKDHTICEDCDVKRIKIEKNQNEIRVYMEQNDTCYIPKEDLTALLI